MQVVASMDPRMPLRDVASYARRLEAMGYDAFHVPETVHDPFTVSLLALEHTTSLVVRTAVLLAFPRSPMLTAYAAWDLARFSSGRFELGLGTQIRKTMEARYAIPWRDPVGRMRDYLGSLRAIFGSFQTGEPLRYEGEHYRFTMLQPVFNPGPIEHDPPPIWLGGVNPAICRLAGESATGLVTHPTNSNPRYLETICLPNLRAGAAVAGRNMKDVELIAASPLITGRTDDDVGEEREHQRRSLALLYSTPAYRPTLELYGWTEIGEKLQQHTREGRWDALHDLVSDEMLDALVPHATYQGLPDVIERWFGALASGVQVPPPRDSAADGEVAEVIRAIQDR